MTLDEELIILLQKEIDILIKLKEITYNKTNIIVSNKVEELESMIKVEEDLINELATKEIERENLLDSWGLDKNMPITDLIEKVPQRQEELNRLREELAIILSEIQSRNITNNELIEENLQWLDFNMNLIYNIQTPPTYGNEDKTQGKNSLFDRKV
ncbi:MAG: flagellar protein FlgN [Tissierellia bacterium]|nr:flagellar protein FlgN [Tissierellia bacterium]